jgi:tRNA G37 N-methylase Trm5
MNINKKEIDALSMETQELLQRYAREEGRDWRVTVEHIERVKSFSPGVMHVVFDVMCSGA